MSESTVVVLALGLGVPLFFVFVIGIILFAGKARPVEGLGPHTGTWNAEVVGTGLLDRTFGTVAIRDGHVWFTPDGAAAPAWAVPCPQVVAGRQSFFSRASVQLTGSWGAVRLNVSREHINRISSNDIKTLREKNAYAAEFLAALGAAGAMVLP